MTKRKETEIELNKNFKYKNDTSNQSKTFVQFFFNCYYCLVLKHYFDNIKNIQYVF